MKNPTKSILDKLNQNNGIKTNELLKEELKETTHSIDNHPESLFIFNKISKYKKMEQERYNILRDRKVIDGQDCTKHREFILFNELVVQYSVDEETDSIISLVERQKKVDNEMTSTYFDPSRAMTDAMETIEEYEVAEKEKSKSESYGIVFS